MVKPKDTKARCCGPLRILNRSDDAAFYECTKCGTKFAGGAAKKSKPASAPTSYEATETGVSFAVKGKPAEEVTDLIKKRAK